MASVQAEMVSVIVPVYNAGKYLREALESVIRQDDPNWELVLVDNGSKDDSPAICKEYAEKYSHIHVFREEKPGAANARNLGLEHANGTYVVFMDADDYLADASILGTLTDRIEQTDADIVVCNYERLWEGKILPAAVHAAFSSKDRNSEDFRFQGFFSGGCLSYVWGKIYRRSFLEEHGIRFVDVEYAEDKLFNLQCYVCRADYAFTDRTGYVYRRNMESVSYQYKPNSRACWLTIAYQLRSLTEESGHAQEYAGLAAYMIFFAAFFDAKMEYVQHHRSLKAVKRTLAAYERDPLAGMSFRRLAFGREVCGLSQTLWKVMLRGFSLGMSCHMFGMLALGIKLLIDMRIDERLSDTGMRDQVMENRCKN